MHKQRPFSLHRQRGNILFLILLAIILFVALSYAIMNQRDGGKTASDEKSQAFAAQILQYLTLVESTVTRMVLSGVPIENLDFRDPNGTSYNIQTTANTNCLDATCQVFNKGGGGVNAMALPPQATDATRNGAYINGAGGAKGDTLFISIKGVGTTLPDLTFIYRAVDVNVCRQINIMAGINTATDNLPTEGMGVGNAGGGSTDYVTFEGNMNPLPVLTADVVGDVDTRLVGKRTFCIWRSASSGYFVIHVVLAR